MGKRRKARECALQFLYRLDFIPGDAGQVSEGFKSFIDDHSCQEGIDLPFAEDLIKGTVESLSEIDGLIQRAAQRWNIDRMAMIDKTILRIGIYELLRYPQTDSAVIINEALEIAKRYSTAESSSFINGILDRIARQNRKEEALPPP